MRGEHDFIETFRCAISDDAHAMRVALNQTNRCVQALVGNVRNDFVNVSPGAIGNRPPLRAIGHLDQAVVVAKPNHGGHGKLQHLLGRARPDASHHGQKIPITKLG